MSYLAAVHSYDVIGVVGLGQSGLSCVRFLLQQGIRPVVFDTRNEPPLAAALAELDQDLELHCGELDIGALAGCDLLVVSPGLDLRRPALQMIRDAGIPIVGDVDIFAQFVQAPVIAITGSNGKSTVTQLTGELLAAAGKNVAIGGNIGVPMLDILAPEVDVYVLELSSFQLDSMHDLEISAAALLNLSDDHLDRYHNRQAYADAKHRIYSSAKLAVWNRDQRATAPQQMPLTQQLSFGSDAAESELPGLFGLRQVDGQWQVCMAGEPCLAADELQLSGMHNLLNVQAALALVYSQGVAITSVLPTLKSFKGLPHRGELVADHAGVRWFNDSKATNIGAAEAAVYGLRPLVKGHLVLIAGGDGKGADFRSFRGALDQVDELIVFGRDAERLAQQHLQVTRVANLSEAVDAAGALTANVRNSAVLLAPACASLDMFANYQQRGEQFKQAVHNYIAASTEVSHG
ncbi:UDP-N-acetylmuramoylalanine--D-glutamate ligase [Pseudidiomarina piscicola]|uniref:UDP-N-acetylmuramoylalanine--D-glutamate ligase n=1 Tax=Pseudidiomarina piscicola TaxID=2614830 RepID=A0A6S6WLM9_9GAMM|nr:UDP-N-acetylmuramoyl-L-alanine--D-glutamate ligase [Pseudidiomarina piscicola]CAB0150990.1 UDP-N-acetylmuramoylalanine--D-glutamate ligase [Pseudidiomarina piscicola]VZT40501.1 UDP-N-acetylmuramoylalanine--D-glutamate ligase [Pseudomonas aeruginosa]